MDKNQTFGAVITRLIKKECLTRTEAKDAFTMPPLQKRAGKSV
ncbi:MAG: hypothetical protein RBQ72_02485 [Desulfobacterium sp.]|nr:hypothetical protein [Desulfobacterium sp.]